MGTVREGATTAVEEGPPVGQTLPSAARPPGVRNGRLRRDSFQQIAIDLFAGKYGRHRVES
jgi:hypothetical protein